MCGIGPWGLRGPKRRRGLMKEAKERMILSIVRDRPGITLTTIAGIMGVKFQTIIHTTRNLHLGLELIRKRGNKYFPAGR